MKIKTINWTMIAFLVVSAMPRVEAIWPFSSQKRGSVCYEYKNGIKHYYKKDQRGRRIDFYEGKDEGGKWVKASCGIGFGPWNLLLKKGNGKRSHYSLKRYIETGKEEGFVRTSTVLAEYGPRETRPLSPDEKKKFSRAIDEYLQKKQSEKIDSGRCRKKIKAK